MLLEKLEIPNSKKEKESKNPGCTAVILHRIKTLGSMLSFVNKAAECSENKAHEAYYPFLVAIQKLRGIWSPFFKTQDEGGENEWSQRSLLELILIPD